MAGRKSAVDLRDAPFVCRGRQFHLKAPPMSAAHRAAVQQVVRMRMVGQAAARVRSKDPSFESWARSRGKQELQDRLEEIGQKLLAKQRNLELQRDTLELLLKQVGKADAAESANAEKAMQDAAARQVHASAKEDAPSVTDMKNLKEEKALESPGTTTQHENETETKVNGEGRVKKEQDTASAPTASLEKEGSTSKRKLEDVVEKDNAAKESIPEGESPATKRLKP